ncbi:Retrotransposon gag protein [Rhizoctonia solani]|uniref:Retrotransposon gag protein n=1 Tax=Rhizoctonia solani TaxID=456999 RepID=A0A8H7M974_9AGAM|nr:Retrotransposon gag protein [Rhizoctonia solani]
MATSSPELGKVSLERVIRLLWGLQSQVDRIERLLEQVEISQEVCTNVKNISQAVNVVKDGLAQLQLPQGPTPQKIKNPPRSRKPQGRAKVKPIGKTQPFLGPQPLSSPQGPPGATPSPSLTLTPPRPSLQDRLQQPPKDLRQHLSLLGVASSPLHCKSGSPRRLQRQDWLGGQTMANLYVSLGPPQSEAVPLGLGDVDEFKNEFLAAFGNPDATRAAERKITSLTQTGTCAKYITKFRMLQMELDWNNAALRGQFAQGLHWEVQKQIATRERQPRTLRELQDASLIIDNALRKERASHPHQGNKSGKSSTTPTGGQVLANRPPKPAPSLPIPTTSWRKNKIAAAQKDSVSNAAKQGTSLLSAGLDGGPPQRG